MTDGAQFTVSIQAQNTGTQPWNSKDYLFDVNYPQKVWTTIVAAFASSSVGPAQNATATFTAVAPAIAGSYPFTWQMADNTVPFGQSCTKTITVDAVCGNGHVEASEQCDDGNTAAGDGCSATCTTEQSYSCSGNPSVCTFSPICGSMSCSKEQGTGSACMMLCTIPINDGTSCSVSAVQIPCPAN